MVSYEYTAGIGNIVTGTDSRPGDIKSIDIVGNVAIVPEQYNGQYWTDGRYNNRNFYIKQGVLVGGNGLIYDTYEINPPTTLHTQSFVGT